MNEKFFVPPTRVTTQGEGSFHDDKVGHDGVLHGSSFVRLDESLLS